MSVPKLRFIGFSGEWEAISLGEISKNIMYGMNSAAIAFDGLNKYIRITDIDEKTREFNPRPLSSPDGKIEDKFKLKIGDLVFARTGASVGKSYLYKEKDGNLLFAGFLVKFSIVDSHPYFIYTKTLTQCYKSWLTVMSMRSGQPGVNAEELKEYKFLSPSLPEQTKIANFLTAVDEKITILTQKADLLSQYKKGVMQQIFSQELRFKDDDGQEFPEWEEKTLGEIFTFIQTNSFSRALLNYESGLVRNIHYGDIHTKYKSNFRINNENAPFINSDVDITNISADCYCKEGDLVIADASEDYADVGKAIEIINIDNQKVLAGLHTYIARDFTKKMSLGFSGYLMQTESVRLQIKILATGISVLGISKGNLAKVQLRIPAFPEQTKIANFLTAIDDKITNHQTQLNALKQYKQGLLQQLFV